MRRDTQKANEPPLEDGGISEIDHVEDQRTLLAAIVESSEDAIITKAPDCTIRTWNAAAEHLYGYTAAEVIGQPVKMLMSADRFDELDKVVGKVLRGEKIHNYETRRRRKDGSLVDVSLSESPVRDATGKIIGVAAIERDISERMRARELESQAAALVKSTAVAIYSLGPGHIVRSWNAGAERLFGYGVDEVIGRPSPTMFSAVQPQLDEHLHRVLALGETVEFESQHRRKDGVVLDVDVTASPIFDASGIASGLAVVTLDITERKRSERMLAAARDEALELARAKSTFLANMSHEIRTPLNAIVGLVGLLAETPLNQEQRDFADSILGGADTLLGIINNVLDFSKVSAGKLLFENVQFEIRFVAETALDLIAETAQKKQLEVALSIDNQVPKVTRGDPGRLRQVLVNLLANAVKFTEHGEIIVSVTLESETDSHALVRLEVSDTGIGISEEVKSCIFEPFYQADSSTTRKYGGSGLGLAISKQLVERMGGRIGVISRPGGGSRFWFTVALEKSSTTPLVAGANGREFADVRALIVDDNETNREIVRQYLESLGLQVDLAESGKRALTMLEQASHTDPYAVAILDLFMPEMDGLELANQIRANPALSTTHLIMMSSARSRKGFAVTAPAIEVWLAKPVKAAHLYRCLTSLHLGATGLRPIVSPQPAPSLNPVAEQNGRILLAEDNPVNLKVAMMQLKGLGYQVDGVTNGKEALDALARRPYDAVLMDCQMPEMDGYEATRQIRKREGNTRHNVVIALTAFGLSGDREKCLESGMDDYLSKPVRKEDLRQILERWLKRGPTMAADSISDKKNAQSNLVFEAKIFNDLRGEGEEFFTELVDMFISDVPNQLDALKQALDQGDAVLAARLAHTLKGTAATFGATQMVQRAGSIDQAARASLLDQARGLFAEFRAECDRVRAALVAERSKATTLDHNASKTGAG